MTPATPRYNPTFLTLSTQAGAVLYRRQNHWLHQAVSFESQSWPYLDFSWSEITSGPLGSSELPLSLPGLPSYRALFTAVLVAELRVFTYLDSQDDSAGPPENMVLVNAAYGMASPSEDILTGLVVRIAPALGGAGQQSGATRATPARVGIPLQLVS